MIQFDNASVLQTIQTEDTSPRQLVTRTAQRIAGLGFDLTGMTRAAGIREGFKWGRSSHGETACTVWTVHFTDASNENDYDVTIIESVDTYTVGNPYDRMPKGNRVASARIQATDGVKRVLNWPTAK